MAKFKLIQVKEDIDQIIIKYFMTSKEIILNKDQAQQLYDVCVDRGEISGTPAFDKAIDTVLDGLKLNIETLTKLTT